MTTAHMQAFPLTSMENGVVVRPGVFAKVFRDGQCIGRAYAQADGSWAIGLGPDSKIVDGEFVRMWAASLALFG